MNSEMLFELYRLFRGELIESYKLHRTTMQHYFAFVIAILGATVAGFFQISRNNWGQTILLCGPILNIFVCLIAMKMCDRSYRGALERTTIILKLENMLQFNRMSHLSTDQTDLQTIFQKDKILLPERWVKSAESYSTSEAFVEGTLNSGVNLLAKRTFQLVIIINILLSGLIIFNWFKE